MNNRDTEAVWAYHNGTKHSLWSIHNDAHYLDFDNQPLPFKIYPDLEPIPLPEEFLPTEPPALSSVASTGLHLDGDCLPDLRTLASVFYHSAGVTKRIAYSGGQMLFRAAACTGALYHIELYLVCGDLPDLDAGIYHFDAHDFALRKLREGDYRGNLVSATGNEPATASAPAVLVCTGTFWRNAWKYRSRTYRHCFWDNGTILANLLAIANAHKIPSRVVGGFKDSQVNDLLSLDTRREVALSLVPLGHNPDRPAPDVQEALPLILNTVRLSRAEVDYPEIRTMHEASSLATEAETAAWHDGPTPVTAMPDPSGQMFALRPYDDDKMAADTTERVIKRRGSTRQFLRKAISFEQLSTVLCQATRGVPADFLSPGGVTMNDLYLVVNSVDGLAPGSYVFHRDKNALEQLDEGDLRRAAGYLGLQQALPADASVDVFFLADLEPILERYGNRGYRAAELEAGIIGGKLYLAAYAQGLGASGLTFFDDDVTAFFSPHAAGKSVMFLVALGVPLRRRRVRA